MAFHNPKQALQAGISIITQELSPVRGMTVAENLYLGRSRKKAGFFFDYGNLNRQATTLLEELARSRRVKAHDVKLRSIVATGQKRLFQPYLSGISYKSYMSPIRTTSSRNVGQAVSPS